jgi:hypothetical protein
MNVLRWITTRSNPRSMSPVTAKKNINTLYRIERIKAVDGGLPGWVLHARREDGTEVELGGFLRRKDAYEAANKDCGLLP